MPEDVTAPQRRKAQWSRMTNVQAIEEFLVEHDYTPEDGDVLVLPDTGQEYVCLGQTFMRPGGRSKALPYLAWASECVVCGVEYDCITPVTFNAITRTCQEHRGQYRGSPPKRIRQGRVKREPRPRGPGVVEEVVLSVLEGLSLVQESVTVKELVEYCKPRMSVPKGRDTRKQRVVRAVDRFERKGKLPLPVLWG